MADESATSGTEGNATAAAPPPGTPDAGQSGTQNQAPSGTSTEQTASTNQTGDTGNTDSEGILGQGGQPGDKAAEGKPDAGAPDKYELTLPEGVELDPAHADEIALFAKERGLSNDVAQAILERDAQYVKAAQETQAQVVKEKRTEWVQSLKSDKEYGGQNFDKTVENANRALRRFAPEGFIDQLGPYVDHDGLIKLLANVGRIMQDDTLVGGTKAPAKSEKTAAQVMYPSMPNP